MTYALPTALYLSVLRVSANTSLHSDGGSLKSSESWSLVLRASPDTNVVLSTGQRLAAVDIHLTLSTKWRTAQELDRDLTPEDVGFLAHTEGERGEPFVHGGALLSSTAIVNALLGADTVGKVEIVLPTVPFEDKKNNPYVWGRNRPNMLRISHLEVSILRGEDTESDG
jgi:hypothetical protein